MIIMYFKHYFGSVCFCRLYTDRSMLNTCMSLTTRWSNWETFIGQCPWLKIHLW